MTVPPLDFPSLWAGARPWQAFLAPSMRHYGLWQWLYDRYRLPAWAAERAATLRGFRLLILGADWCGDAANSMPVMARLAEAIPDGALRVLVRDEHPTVMDHYLTNGSRSIPIAIWLDDEFEESGHWGPRPEALQAWVLAHRGTMPDAERYAETRRRYARDRGETILRELLAANRTR